MKSHGFRPFHYQNDQRKILRLSYFFETLLFFWLKSGFSDFRNFRKTSNLDLRHFVLGRIQKIRNRTFSEKVEILRFRPFHYQNDHQKILRLLKGNIIFSETISTYDILYWAGYRKTKIEHFRKKSRFSVSGRSTIKMITRKF